jgi:hypothetical protein
LCFCLVLSHYYGTDGRESKKIDTKCIPLDFEFFRSLAQENFVAKLSSSIQQFVEYLNNNKNDGI